VRPVWQRIAAYFVVIPRELSGSGSSPVRRFNAGWFEVDHPRG